MQRYFSSIEIESQLSNDSDSEEEEGTKISKQRKSELKRRCSRILDHMATTVLMAIVVIYALYIDDVRILAVTKSGDIIVTIFSSLSFFLFLTEIFIQSWCRDNYLQLPNKKKVRKAIHEAKNFDDEKKWHKFREVLRSLKVGSFYFWLDLMATLSMIPELPWLYYVDSNTVLGNIDSARAGRASRAGARAARVVRIVRMIRLVRLVKLYNIFSRKRHSSISPDPASLSKLRRQQPESHVGAEMSDRTTKKVIVGILMMLIVIPILNFEEVGYYDEFGMQMVLDRRLNIVEAQSSNYDVLVDSWKFTEELLINSTTCIGIEYTGFDDDLSIVSATIPELRPQPESLRNVEMNYISITGGENDDYALSAIFDASQRARMEALYGIFLTSFVILLLAVGTMTFSRDVNNLVIIPIERMVQLVKEISANPLGKDYSVNPEDMNDMDEGMETTLLLRTISKIAGLMRIGFGEAGAEIIGRNLANMSSQSNSNMSMNLLGHGSKIYSIFGFCDIRNFTDVTECLQEEVMLFVNRIAHILHSVVVACDGAANKNVGDAFLLTWKIDKKQANLEKNDDSPDDEENYVIAADKAMFSMIKTMIEMKRHENFICDFSPKALGALYERIPGYKCRIGCGLHCGWAVEGAIGSDTKIDPTYVSPHVNMTEFLESSTKEYGCQLLLSEPFFKLLSPVAAKYVRQVDQVKTGNFPPVGLYTYEINLDMDLNSDSDMKLERGSKTKAPLVDRATIFTRGVSKSISIPRSVRHASSTISLNIDSVDIDIPHFTTDIWEEDNDIVETRSHFSFASRMLWKRGIQAYIDGNWDVARTVFMQLQNNNVNDGPSKHLLKVMEKNNFEAPENWEGYRLV